MTGAVKTNKNTERTVDKEKLYSKPSIKYISENLFDILTQIDSSIKYYLKRSDKQKLTDEQKHVILQTIAGNEDVFKKLTNEEKLKILEKLFVGDEEKLENLANKYEEGEILKSYGRLSDKESPESICEDELLGIFDNLLKGNKEKTIENLGDNEKNKILYDLFLGKEGELDSSFLYNGKGAELYEKISKDKNYPFIDVEKNMLNYLSRNQKFREVMEKTKYITDVGAGDGGKALALLGSYWWYGTYIPEDYSPEMLQIAARNITKGAPKINLGSLNILTNGKHLTSNLDNNIYLFLGGTICNMTDEQIIKELKNMDNNGILSGNHILLSYFTAPNTQEEIDELIKIYNSDNNRRFHENGMEMLGLSHEDFEYDTVYEKDNPTQKNGPFPGRIKGIIRAKKDCTVKLGRGKGINITKGQEFTLHYSRRFTKKGIKKLFDESGCKVVFTEEEKGDSIALLKRAPIKREILVDKITPTKTFVNKIKEKLHQLFSSASNKPDQETENNISPDGAFNNSIRSINYTIESQVSEELLTAIGLNKANNETKKAVNLGFNSYIKNYRKESFSTEDLILAFRNDMGVMLIHDYGAMSPYNFITKELIDNTNFATNKDKIYERSIEFNTGNKSSKYVEFKNSETHELYSKGKKYYIKIGETFSGYKVLGASDSPNGPFSMEKFNDEISEHFERIRHERIPNKIEQKMENTSSGIKKSIFNSGQLPKSA